MNHRHSMIIGGREFDCAARVYTWYETGIEFRAGDGYNKRRKKEIDLWVWHWTGGEGKPSTMAETLRAKKLGVETAIYRGEIWQFCDPLIVDTADAGIVNARSGGTEIINYGYRRKKADIPRAGKNRAMYNCCFRDGRRRFAHFHPVDIAAAIALSETMAKALGIPRRIPLDPDDMLTLPRTMSASELEEFSGHVGHFHISDRKIDPGLDLLEALRACWSDEI